MRQRLIEGGADQGGEGRVTSAIMIPDLLKYLLAIEARMLVARPRVNCIAAALQVQRLYRLTERKIREACMRSKLDNEGWSQRFHQPEGEWRMFKPCALRGNLFGRP